MKPTLRTVKVAPVIPESLRALEQLAYNVSWDWLPEIAELFDRLDSELWARTGHNPVALLGLADQRRLEAVAKDAGFTAHLSRAKAALDAYTKEPRWFQKTHSEDADLSVAYFSAEFGLHGSLPVYSGGLGILAGDHLKSASDLGLPLVGVGLLYQEGYFRQYLNADGWQMETYPPNDFYTMPLRPVLTAEGRPLKVSVEFPGRLVFGQIWRVDVGRIPLFLLDTNVPENSDEDRRITRALYSGGVEMRIQQLMMLGIGGYRALVAMGREPLVCHMNEGHAGFLGVERTRSLMKARGLDYELARDIVEDGNIFTTHTPVPAGFDVFSTELVAKYMKDYIQAVGLSFDDFMALGRRNRRDPNEPFNMAIVAIRHSTLRNGVSRLHGQVSRRLVQDGGAWRKWPTEEVPIDAVTNGIHTLTWIAPQLAALLDRYLGANWRSETSRGDVWQRIDAIPEEELWHVHSELRHALVAYVRRRLRWQLERRGAMDNELEAVQHALNPEVLTVGFARRVATYKRATLLFTDVERLRRIVSSSDRPVQFIFSGKAHPEDRPAKEFIKAIINHLKEDRFARSIVFLEDYDIDVAKHLVRGVDVWLNNPQRPREASGTSGMKVVPNGGLNLSVLDGWWAEGYAPGLGWAIGNGEVHDPSRDAVEGNALYDLLETVVAPTFYERDARGCPLGWVRMMKASMGRLTAQFSTERMVQEYTSRFYLKASRRFRAAMAGDVTDAAAVVAWKHKVRESWQDVRILDIRVPANEILMTTPFEIRARIALGKLSPEDVDVQVYHGALDARDEIHQPSTSSMERIDAGPEGVHEYRCRVSFFQSGRYGYTVRVVPRRAGVLVPNELTSIRWADG